jgi:hypothetical protein
VTFAAPLAAYAATSARGRAAGILRAVDAVARLDADARSTDGTEVYASQVCEHLGAGRWVGGLRLLAGQQAVVSDGRIRLEGPPGCSAFQRHTLAGIERLGALVAGAARILIVAPEGLAELFEMLRGRPLLRPDGVGLLPEPGAAGAPAPAFVVGAAGGRLAVAALPDPWVVAADLRRRGFDDDEVRAATALVMAAELGRMPVPAGRIDPGAVAAIESGAVQRRRLALKVRERTGLLQHARSQARTTAP